MKTRLICLAAAMLSLAACDDGPTSGQPTRIVCHSGGVKTVDDFAQGDVNLVEGGIRYSSQTTGATSRATGDCAAFRSAIPQDWKPFYRT